VFAALAVTASGLWPQTLAENPFVANKMIKWQF
jgi:hypothetical protein